MTTFTMTEEQIANFRKVLLLMIGPYAMMMPDEDVVSYAKKFQQNLDGDSESEEDDQ